MNPLTIVEARKIFASTKKYASNFRKTKVIVAPPALFLGDLLPKIKNSKLDLAIQNIYPGETGSFTGEVSSFMAKKAGIKYAIIGHSERRAMGETNDIISQKLKNALEIGMTPILCLGEKTRSDSGAYLSELEKQIKESLDGISKNNINSIIFAYEPVWAIGQKDGNALGANEIFEMVVLIRKVLTEKYDRHVAESVLILYGGSVSSKNIEQIIKDGRVDGVLVGHLSLYVEEVKSILEVLNNLSPRGKKK